ncbi:MAG TPA: LacI family DNA-binding transcriptional regulator [Ktedonobacteraceae bacterium]|nr:LacI family DNA-binding transcriptional regulator [Ktedonobacteraceae bacterium]
MAEKRTIDDIARLAGVSKATVSRVLNHKPDVDPNTRERILRIVEEQGFVPSITASGLAGGRSRLIGVLVPSFTWPFIPNIMRGIAEVIGETVYELVLYSINDSTRENDKGDVIDHILATKLTAGLLAVLPGPSAKYVVRLHKHGFPVVLIDDQELPPNVPWVGADNCTGAYEAVLHLIRLGHRRIAHIQGPMKNLCSRERYEGYCRALQEEGLTPDPDLVAEGCFTALSGRAAADKFFSLPEDRRPTAIFAGSDQMAYGVMASAEEHGLRIPRDLALVGFDDLESSAHVRPALTTVRQPFYEMGQCSIELLLSMLDKPRHSTVRTGVRAGISGSASSVGTGFHMPSTYSVVSGGVNNGNGSGPVQIQLATSLIVRSSCGASQQFSDSTTGTT